MNNIKNKFLFLCFQSFLLLSTPNFGLSQALVTEQQELVRANQLLLDGNTESAVSVFQKLINSPDIAISRESREGLGDAYFKLGNFGKAIDEYNFLLANSANLVNSEDQKATYLSKLGRSFYINGDASKAQHYLGESRELFEVNYSVSIDRILTYVYLSRIFSEQANVKDASENLERAFIVLERYLPGGEPLLPSSEANSQDNFLAFGNHENAQPLAGIFGKIPIKACDLPDNESYQSSRLVYSRVLELSASAISLFREFEQSMVLYLQLFEQSDLCKLEALYDYGLILRALGQINQSVQVFEEAYEPRKGNEAIAETSLLRNVMALGDIYFELGDFNKAIPFLQKVKESRIQVGSLEEDHPELAEHNGKLSLAYTLTGKYDDALSYGLEASAITLLKQKATYWALNSVDKLSFNRQHAEYFGATMYSASQIQNSDYLLDIFELILSFKGSASSLTNAQALLTVRAQNDLELRAALEKYKSAQINLARVIGTGNIRDNYTQAQIQLLEAEQNLALFENSLSEYFQSISIEDLAINLPKNTLYIDFVIYPVGGQDHVFVFGFIPEEFIYFSRIGNYGEIRLKYENYNSHIFEIDKSNESTRLSMSIYSDLLSGVFENLNSDSITRVIVSPDGFLNYLPFDTFIKEDKRLGDIVNLQYVPSARDFVRLANAAKLESHSGRSASETAITIFANPDFGFVSSEFELPEITNDDQVRGGLSSWVEFDNEEIEAREVFPRFGNLPGTELEGKVISELFSAKGLTTKVFFGKDADERSLFSITDTAVLHLATHGYFLSDTKEDILPNPWLRGGIALAGYNSSWESGEEDIGIVTAFKLANLNLLNTDLVVLSACDTGLGDAVIGESVAGLGQALFSAGAQQLILSLWKVPDLEVVDFMESFYEFYLETNSANKALSQAKKSARENGISESVWASFILIGFLD